MNLLKVALRLADKVSKPRIAYAHCDVPCGIYETDTMRHSVETVKSITLKLLALEHPKEGSPVQFLNTAARMVATKEEFAQKCKTELLILWTDYFKPEHLQKWPELHEKVWKAAKLCSEVKRSVDMAKVEALEKAVSEIAQIFADSKK